MIEAVYKASLTKRATLVIFYLINRANKELTCFPGIKTIAADCNMSDRTVRRALDDLIECGFVLKESRYRENGGQSSNLYTLDISEKLEANESEYISDNELYVTSQNKETDIAETVDFSTYAKDDEGNVSVSQNSTIYDKSAQINDLVICNFNHPDRIKHLLSGYYEPTFLCQGETDSLVPP
ncbi:hypothetical protein DWB64_13320 [Fusibacter sp. A1]|nr:hypothetical protein [Fusibacter sp. A1]RXV60387.1 hypothetical protein DWB64_13320 [Fusibacter sp. A1]